MEEISGAEVLLRILVAVVPAALIGIEREFGQRAAGLRTHTMVSLGACLFTLAGVGLPGSDQTRIAAQVASGIGFLGAGVILRDQFRIKGLTTAASLWVTAAVGVAAGLGAYTAAGTAAVVALLLLVPLKWLERELFPARGRLAFSVAFGDEVGGSEAEQQLREVLGEISIRRLAPQEGGGTAVHGETSERADPDLVRSAEDLRAIPGVSQVDIQLQI
jgi:putative Mg2+ transporter-C (MgtC) family protein